MKTMQQNDTPVTNEIQVSLPHQQLSSYLGAHDHNLLHVRNRHIYQAPLLQQVKVRS